MGTEIDLVRAIVVSADGLAVDGQCVYYGARVRPGTAAADVTIRDGAGGAIVDVITADGGTVFDTIGEQFTHGVAMKSGIHVDVSAAGGEQVTIWYQKP